MHRIIISPMRCVSSRFVSSLMFQYYWTAAQPGRGEKATHVDQSQKTVKRIADHPKNSAGFIRPALEMLQRYIFTVIPDQVRNDENNAFNSILNDLDHE